MLRQAILALVLALPALAQHTVTLTWTPSVTPPAVTTYEIHRSTNCNATTCKGFTKIATVPDTVSTYIDTLPATILAGRRVCYYLLAVGPTGSTLSAHPTFARVTVP